MRKADRKRTTATKVLTTPKEPTLVPKKKERVTARERKKIDCRNACSVNSDGPVRRNSISVGNKSTAPKGTSNILKTEVRRAMLTCSLLMGS